MSSGLFCIYPFSVCHESCHELGMATPPSKSISSFIWAFTASWLSAMSGVLSVPLAIASVLIQARFLQIGMALLAIACLMSASYAVWRRERETIVDLETKISNRARLAITGPDMRIDNRVRRWRMTIKSVGLVAAENVSMVLRSVVPRPEDTYWRDECPHRVLRSNTSEKMFDCTINPSDEESFDIFAGWQNVEGKLYTSGLDTTKRGLQNSLGFEPNEKWLLSYEVTSANADPIKFQLIARVESNAEVLELVLK